MRNTETKIIGSNAGITGGTSTNYSVVDMTVMDTIAGFSNPSFQRREGQQIYVSGFRINFQVANLIQAAESTIYPIWTRCLVLEAKMLQGTETPLAGTQSWLQPNGVAIGYSSMANTFEALTNKVDPKHFKVLMDTHFQCGTQGNGTNITKRSWWVPYKKKINFKGNQTGDQLQDRRVFFVYFGYNPRKIDATWDARYNYTTFVKDP